MLQKLLNLLFPPKCVLCKGILAKDETDFCHTCRKDAPEFKKSNLRFSCRFVNDVLHIWERK